MKELRVVVAALVVTLMACSEVPTHETEEAVLQQFAAESTFTSAPAEATIGDAYIWPKCMGEGSGIEGFVSVGIAIADPFEAESAATVLSHYEATAVADGWDVVESEATSTVSGSGSATLLIAERVIDGIVFEMRLSLMADGYRVTATPELGTFCTGDQWEQ